MKEIVMEFKKAEKSQSKLRLGIAGTAGSGKTYSSLAIATHLGKKVALIDTENGSASKYADYFSFDVLELSDYHPDKFVLAIRAAVEAHYDVIIIDSLSHAWAGKNGALELNQLHTNASKSGNSFTAWAKTTPIWSRLIEEIVRCPVHIIATLRSKTEYVLGENGGKSAPKKLGMAPIIRDGSEYEFDILGEMSQDHIMTITKSRCIEVSDAIIDKPGQAFAEQLKSWLCTGVEAKPTAVNLTETQRTDLLIMWYDRLEQCTQLDTLAEAFKAGISDLKAMHLSPEQMKEFIAKKDDKKFKLELGESLNANE